jgi:ABC-type sugar transport system substrate-binding protein
MVISVSQQATALGSLANAANVPFNSQVTNWISSNPGVATVSGTGLVTAVGAGSATIHATAFGSIASVGITVSPVTLQITRSGSGLNLAWPLGQLQQTTNLLSAWSSVISAVSPYSVTNSSASEMFYRVQVQ